MKGSLDEANKNLLCLSCSQIMNLSYSFSAEMSSSSSSSQDETNNAIIQSLQETDTAMKNYNIEFFIDIDGIKGIIHVRKWSDPLKYSAMFTYIIFRKFQLIETKECSSLPVFMIELDKMLQLTFTNKFQPKTQNDCFVSWRNYIHFVQDIKQEDIACYICLEDSFDSKLACGHYLCQKCIQKSEKNVNMSTSVIKCGICRKKIIRKVSGCIAVNCNHRLCRFSEEVIST